MYAYTIRETVWIFHISSYPQVLAIVLEMEVVVQVIARNVMVTWWCKKRSALIGAFYVRMLIFTHRSLEKSESCSIYIRRFCVCASVTLDTCIETP